MAKINTVMADAEEKFVKNFIIYGKKADTFAYADAAKKTKITKEDLKNMYLKGVMVDYEGALYAPVYMKEDTSAGTVTIAIWDIKATTAPAAVELKSSNV